MHTLHPAGGVTPYRFDITTFHRMTAAGIFREDEHIELIEGGLITMSPIGEAHSGKTKRLIRLFSLLVGDSALLDVQNPLVLDAHNEPEPDFMLLRNRADFYETAKPRPEDVLLLIEVADTSLEYDKEVKIPLYARHGIPEVWLLDLRKQAMTIYRRPTADGYQEIRQAGWEETITPVRLPMVAIRVATLWGR